MDPSVLAAYERERSYAIAKGRDDLAALIDEQIRLLGGNPGVEKAVKTERKRTAKK